MSGIKYLLDTALCAGLQLLTQDAHLKSVIASTGEI